MEGVCGGKGRGKGRGMGTGVGEKVVVVVEFRAWLLLGEVVVFDFFELDHFGFERELMEL